MTTNAPTTLPLNADLALPIIALCTKCLKMTPAVLFFERLQIVDSHGGVVFGVGDGFVCDECLGE